MLQKIFYCHNYHCDCAQLGTSWDAIVVAFRVVSNRESWYPFRDLKSDLLHPRPRHKALLEIPHHAQRVNSWSWGRSLTLYCLCCLSLLAPRILARFLMGPPEGLCLSVNQVWVYLNNHGTGFLGPNQTNNWFGAQRKLKLANSSFEFADWLKNHSTSFQHLACQDRTICGSLFRYFRSKLSWSTDKHDPKGHPWGAPLKYCYTNHKGRRKVPLKGRSKVTRALTFTLLCVRVSAAATRLPIVAVVVTVYTCSSRNWVEWQSAWYCSYPTFCFVMSFSRVCCWTTPLYLLLSLELVQRCLGAALGQAVRFFPTSRTDSGVLALGQYKTSSDGYRRRQNCGKWALRRLAVATIWWNWKKKKSPRAEVWWWNCGG